MEKSELMRKIEREAELDATIQTGTCGELPRWWYVLELERRLEKMKAKAAAYDDLMQRQVTMQELANATNHPVAVSEDRTKFIVFSNEPELEDFCCGEEEGDHLAWIGERLFSITLKETYDGCWWTSLTMPDGWEEA